jgi:hypothetical protein
MEPVRMPIQDVHLLIAQARVEADDPAFRSVRRCAIFVSTSAERNLEHTSHCGFASVENPGLDDEETHV